MSIKFFCTYLHSFNMKCNRVTACLFQVGDHQREHERKSSSGSRREGFPAGSEGSEGRTAAGENRSTVEVGPLWKRDAAGKFLTGGSRRKI